LACDDGGDGDSAVLSYSAQNNIRGFKSRKIRYVAWVRIITKKKKFVGRRKERNILGDVCQR
jgi:hypothetical protein